MFACNFIRKAGLVPSNGPCGIDVIPYNQKLCFVEKVASSTERKRCTLLVDLPTSLHSCTVLILGCICVLAGAIFRFIPCVLLATVKVVVLLK